ncbi:extracellular solute-binding protein [Streptomyces sp. M19]
MVDAFEKQYPEVQVKWVDQPAENYPEKLSADAGAGDLPDVVNVSPDLAYPLAKAGLLMNLDKEKASSRFTDEYTRRRGGATPCRGWTARTPSLVPQHRAAVLQQGALREGGLDPAKPPRTYAQLFDAANTMAKKSGGGVATLASTRRSRTSAATA